MQDLQREGTLVGLDVTSGRTNATRSPEAGVETDIEEEVLQIAHHLVLAAEAEEISATRDENGLLLAPEVPLPEAPAEARESPREGSLSLIRNASRSEEKKSRRNREKPARRILCSL